MPNLPAAARAIVPAPASTVVLLRDAADGGLTVFMVKRPPAVSFAAEAQVFPGGLVDSDDARPQILARSPGLDPAEAARRMGMAEGDEGNQCVSHYVAAVRELFEETGILLGRREDGQELSADDAAALKESRVELLNGHPFWEVLNRRGLIITPEALVYVARFVTPEGGRKRFDARFFLLHAPTGQNASVHAAEATEGGWYRPEEVLERHRRDDLTLLPPTRVMCVELARHPDTLTALTKFGRNLDVRRQTPLPRAGR